MHRSIRLVSAPGKAQVPPGFRRRLTGLLLQALAAEGRLTPAQYRRAAMHHDSLYRKGENCHPTE